MIYSEIGTMYMRVSPNAVVSAHAKYPSSISWDLGLGRCRSSKKVVEKGMQSRTVVRLE